MSAIVAIQINASDNIDDNLSVIRQMIVPLAEQGIKVFVLPECAAFMQKTRQQLYDNAETYGAGKIQNYIANLARQQNCWIILGSVALTSNQPDKIFNSLLVYDDAGECVARYDKLHLFDVQLSQTESYNESDFTISGNHTQLIDSPVGRIGLSICYDLRFPELYRSLTEQGAEILVVPAAFSCLTGEHHWLPLLQARAIENSCYVVAPAQAGTHPDGRKTWGHSMILNPWGGVLAQLSAGYGAITAQIDLSKLGSIRQRLPALKHKREDIFK